MLEVIAGSVAEGENHFDVARAELMEEAGYRIEGDLEPISTFFVSLGGASEKIVLFLGRMSKADRIGLGGGVGEGEDIDVVDLPFDTALAMIDGGEIIDAKTIIALQ